MKRFDARFDSDCEHCGSPICAGDSIGYIDDEVACDHCCNAQEVEEDEDDCRS